MNEERIYLADAAKLFCPWGIRKWCTDNGVDIRTLKTQGVDLSEARRMAGAMAEAIIAAKYGVCNGE